MLLRQGDSGDAVKDLQRGLNKLGAMLLVDGGFGPETGSAIIDARAKLSRPGPPEADNDFQTAVALVPDLCPPLTASGVTFIAREEVTSPSAYRQKYQTPCWPGPKSGITIGIGYDCQFVTPAQFQSDWADVLSPAIIDHLLPALGAVGSADRLAQLKNVTIPPGGAVTVFAKTLIRYLEQTRAIYPEVDTISPARRTALVSIVYNRGPRLTDIDNQRRDRLEMRNIRDLLVSGNPDNVADQIDSMARLWTDGASSGLVKRRHAEATLWRSGFAALELD